MESELKPELLLAVGSNHIHVCEIVRGVAHIAWSSRVRPHPEGFQPVNGNEPWIAAAALVVADTPRYYARTPLDNADHLADSLLRPRMEAAGVPVV